MQTLELKLPTDVLLVWGFPESTDFDSPFEAIEYNGDSYLVYSQHSGHIITRDLLPYGKWQPIGRLSELTDTDCCKIVDVSVHSGLSAHYTKGVNHPNVYCYESSLDSLHSAIEAEGHYFTNPYGEPPNGLDPLTWESESFESDVALWKEAQSKTLPANTLIFKR